MLALYSKFCAIPIDWQDSFAAMYEFGKIAPKAYTEALEEVACHAESVVTNINNKLTVFSRIFNAPVYKPYPCNCLTSVEFYDFAHIRLHRIHNFHHHIHVLYGDYKYAALKGKSKKNHRTWYLSSAGLHIIFIWVNIVRNANRTDMFNTTHIYIKAFGLLFVTLQFRACQV